LNWLPCVVPPLFSCMPVFELPFCFGLPVYSHPSVLVSQFKTILLFWSPCLRSSLCFGFPI
jgi:hypothetical protein